MARTHTYIHADPDRSFGVNIVNAKLNTGLDFRLVRSQPINTFEIKVPRDRSTVSAAKCKTNCFATGSNLQRSSVD